jgi:hypothetical protein
MCTPVLIDIPVKAINIVVTANLYISATRELSLCREAFRSFGQLLIAPQGGNSYVRTLVRITSRNPVRHSSTTS